MRSIIFIFSFALLPAVSMSQPGVNNQIRISASASNLQFEYANIGELLQPKIINQAIQVDVDIKRNHFSIAARLNFENIPASQVPSNWLTLRWNEFNSSQNVTLTANQVTLHNSDVTLFSQELLAQDVINNGMQHFSYKYDVILNPQTTFVKPDDYDFTILFTMTMTPQ